MQNNKWFTLHVAEYLKTHSGQDTGFCNAMLIDSDTLFVRPVGGYLVDCGVSPDWDVGFTVYDPEFVVPWASDSAQVGRTRGKGFSRINTGVVLLNLRAPRAVQDFLVRWAQATIWLTSSGEEDIGHTWQEPDLLRWQHWHDELVEEFKGPNQASMALLVCSYQIDRLGDVIGWGAECAACLGPVEARLDLIDGERAMPVRFRALPARVLNHPESMPEGAFPPDLAVVHLKGLWWRLALPSGRARFVDHFRRRASGTATR
ncbi:unnamed protein product [Prorocentrum cordatum]|uniref:Nucleotide-diphospho-sugar transferase domain-containing protein n=1 Tax=Prorocentrum cordatum TaxID=2364126 RepID=A0ABN9UDQ7_9DINO|nr:unnamed protein product [Polarella glacialis]